MTFPITHGVQSTSHMHFHEMSPNEMHSPTHVCTAEMKYITLTEDLYIPTEQSRHLLGSARQANIQAR